VAQWGNQCKLDCIRILLEHGADTGLPFGSEDDEYHQPLRSAARKVELKVCRLLVEVGRADPLSPMAKDDKGKFCLKDSMPVDATERNNVLNLLCSLAGVEE
jgi:hypothetical protein